MDKEPKHEEMCQVLNTGQEKHPSLGQAVLANLWDSVESDTESLAQERAYQQQLQKRIGYHNQNKHILTQQENTDSFQQGDGENKNASDDKTEDLQVYDSLDVAADPHAERNPTLVHTEYLDTQIADREGSSQLLSDDGYSDLRYEPNWKTNLRGAGCLNESPHSSIEEYYQVPKKQSSQSCGEEQGLVIKGGYRYIVDTSPAVIVTPHMAGNEPNQPYRLHLQDDQTNSETSPHNHALQRTSPEADHLQPPAFSTKTESDKSSQKGLRDKHEYSCDSTGDNVSRSPGLTEDVRAISIQEFKTYQQQELRQGGSTQNQQMGTFPKVSLSKKPEKPTEDIVERNKLTLGRNKSKRGSYVHMHAPKQETPNKVTQISKGKKVRQKEHPSPSQQQQYPAGVVRAERGDCLSSPSETPAAISQPNPQKMTPSQPLVPAVHPNIQLNSLSQLLPFIQQRGQDDIINLASLHGYTDWSPVPEPEPALSPGCQQMNPGKSRKGLKAHFHHQNLEGSPKQWQRTTMLKGLLSSEEGDQMWSPNEVHTKQFHKNLPRTPTTPSSLGSGGYTVLPPIRPSLTGEESDLSPGQSVNTAIHRSSSDGYLVQMQKQKQLRARVTYKAYSLKDYKQLKSDINLRGLGPDYTAIEKTAEKMKRQKLYSNVIREQNKKIRRIPFLLAKDLEGNDKKVPRIKALEYAKTIAKPPVQSQPKQRQKDQSEDFIEHTPYTEDLGNSQLEILRKRHEQEKQAVAHLRKVHAV
ncbi:jhy protein homolog [Plectropomus leopardus]|uniref:jhy protein homolog n=1 Tax=Plectropomus leopardus TaxID=160734 RepID=UPI001C4D86E4|nr:jhy protein homolog [Plectropomus leopardus]